MKFQTQVEAAWSRLVRGVRLAPAKSQGLRGGMRRLGATCTAAQTRMRLWHSRAEIFTTGAVWNRAAPSRSRRNAISSVRCFASTDCSGRRVRIRVDKAWAAHLRSKVPARDIRQDMRDFLTTPAHMSGRRRETHLATKLGELAGDGARTRGKCAKPMHMVHAAEACSFCAGSRAGRVAPATCGKRVPAEGEGEMPRGRACVGSRRTYS